MALTIRILGSFEVYRDEVAVGPGPEAARPRALLALLTVRANEIVAKESLVDELWSDPPASARNLVEKYVSLWRKVLDPEQLQTVGKGYRLRLSRAESELIDLNRRLDEGRQRVQAVDVAGAAAVLGAAFAQWRGGDVEAYARGLLPPGEAHHLVELHLRTLEDWAAAALATGDVESLQEPLREALGRHPYRERIAELLMWAHYQRGEQAEALAVHTGIREALDSGLGQVPGAALGTMLARVLRQDPALAAPGRTTQPFVPNLPARGRRFVGREAALAETERALSAPDGDHDTVAVAVWGGVGVGKTALVLEYAHRRRERYAVLWYVNASSRTSVTDGIEALAVRLGVRLPTTDREAHLHLLWDALRQAGRWLLIFDDAEHPADLADHWPSVGGGHVLVTSLNPDWGHRARLLELGVFSRAETVHYLRSRTGRSDASDDELARELDGLALACEQAAAYMRQTGLAAGEYLPLFRRRRAQLLERGAPDDHRDTIGTTWRLALAQLSEASPGSVQLLLLCAQLAPEAVPLDLLRSSVVILPEELHRVVHDDLALEDAIGHIRRYSLMSRDGDHLQMHRLVQAVVRGAMPPRERALWWRRALRLLVDRPPAAPGDLASWSCWQAFLPHIAFLTEELAAASPGEGDEMIALPEDARRGFVEIVHRAAEYLVVRGSFDDAQNLLSCLLTVLRRPASGDGCGAVAATLVLLGEVVERLGRAEEALRDYRTALDVLGPRHGPDHPWVARASTGLARMLTCHEGATRWQPENLAEAEESFVRSLSVLTAQLGQGHPVVAQTLAGLGQIRQDRGDPLTAVACFEEALATLEQVYGPDHPDVGHAHDRLGYALRLVGDHAGARAGHERALAVLTHAYGEGHVETGWPWSNLGVLLLDGGLTHEAVAAQERAHAVFEANLGQTVPTQIAAWRLALAHARAGAAETARELLASVVPRLAALLGERHPDAVAATADLDHVIRLSGSRADGLEGLRQLPKVPGPKRPEAADRAAELR